ncbi:hypothetical protein VNO77_03287 [Canavalia gladiata]|uniref:Uncharacterized protein n=1 Tax=Canavalia gladiata TaxID=3824 RepID=A0AAN9N039_CANGL
MRLFSLSKSAHVLHLWRLTSNTSRSGHQVLQNFSGRPLSGNVASFLLDHAPSQRDLHTGLSGLSTDSLARLRGAALCLCVLDMQASRLTSFLSLSDQEYIEEKVWNRYSQALVVMLGSGFLPFVAFPHRLLPKKLMRSDRFSDIWPGVSGNGRSGVSDHGGMLEVRPP